jgi:c-di-AMP phosphodiesterase-like protein
VAESNPKLKAETVTRRRFWEISNNYANKFMDKETKRILIYILIYFLSFLAVIWITINIFDYTESLITSFIVISILGYALYFIYKEKKDVRERYEQLLRYSYENIKKKKAPELLDDELVDFEEEFRGWLMNEKAKQIRVNKQKVKEMTEK